MGRTGLKPILTFHIAPIDYNAQTYLRSASDKNRLRCFRASSSKMYYRRYFGA